MKRCSRCGEVKALGEFYLDKRRRDGRRADCKVCRSEYRRRYRLANRDVLNEKSRRYHEANRKQIAERRRCYREANPEKEKERNRRYNEANLERIAEFRLQWREVNKEKILEQSRRWNDANSEKVNGYSRRRRARKVNAPGGGFTDAQFQELCTQAGGQCLACGEIHPLTADHIVPLSKRGRDAIDNIQPLCQSCNSSKHTKTIDYRFDNQSITVL